MPVVPDKVTVPDKKDATGKFEVVLLNGEYVVYNPEGVRISGPMGEAAAQDLAFRMQQFKR